MRIQVVKEKKGFYTKAKLKDIQIHHDKEKEKRNLSKKQVTCRLEYCKETV